MSRALLENLQKVRNNTQWGQVLKELSKNKGEWKGREGREIMRRAGQGVDCRELRGLGLVLVSMGRMKYVDDGFLARVVNGVRRDGLLGRDPTQVGWLCSGLSWLGTRDPYLTEQITETLARWCLADSPRESEPVMALVTTLSRMRPSENNHLPLILNRIITSPQLPPRSVCAILSFAKRLQYRPPPEVINKIVKVFSKTEQPWERYIPLYLHERSFPATGVGRFVEKKLLQGMVQNKAHWWVGITRWANELLFLASKSIEGRTIMKEELLLNHTVVKALTQVVGSEVDIGMLTQAVSRVGDEDSLKVLQSLIEAESDRLAKSPQFIVSFLYATAIRNENWMMEFLDKYYVPSCIPPGYVLATIGSLHSLGLHEKVSEAVKLLFSLRAFPYLSTPDVHAILQVQRAVPDNRAITSLLQRIIELMTKTDEESVACVRMILKENPSMYKTAEQYVGRDKLDGQIQFARLLVGDCDAYETVMALDRTTYVDVFCHMHMFEGDVEQGIIAGICDRKIDELSASECIICLGALTKGTDFMVLQLFDSRFTREALSRTVTPEQLCRVLSSFDALHSRPEALLDLINKNTQRHRDMFSTLYKTRPVQLLDLCFSLQNLRVPRHPSYKALTSYVSAFPSTPTMFNTCKAISAMSRSTCVTPSLIPWIETELQTKLTRSNIGTDTIANAIKDLDAVGVVPPTCLVEALELRKKPND